jgi:O-Antigen ligase
VSHETAHVGESTSTSAVSRAWLPLERVRREPLEALGSVALVLLAPAVLVYLSFNAGGYFPTAPAFVTIVLAQALVLRTTLAARPFEGFCPALAAPLTALALYGAWQLASLLWSHGTARALDSYDLTLLYLLALALFGAPRYTHTRAAWLIRAVAAGLAAVCLIGLVSRVLPHAWPTAASFFAERLNYPLTYWNAEGMVAAIVLVLALHLCADRDEHPVVRVISAALFPAVAATLLLTFSRGALGAAVIGLLAYCLLARPATLASALLALAPTTAIALHSAWDATLLATRNPTSPAAIAQGRHVALVVGLCMLGAGALRALLLLADDRLQRLARNVAPPGRPVRIGAGAAMIALLVALALALGAGGFAKREYDRFVNGNGVSTVVHTRERLTDPGNNGRLALWTAAIRIYERHPLHGSGAGSYQPYYFRYRSEPLYVTDAHSLYLQSLAELGIVGLALIVVAIGAMLGGLASRARGRRRAVPAAVLAVVLAWAVHQAFDWDWQMPAVTLGVVILAGCALARPASRRAGLSGLPANRTLVALGWLALAITPLLAGTSYTRLADSARDLSDDDCAAAKSEALSSLSLSAKRPQAYTIIGVCDLELGFAQAGVAAAQQARALEPDSWEGDYWLALARAADGLDPRAPLARAHTLNPLSPLVANAILALHARDPHRWEAAAPALRREALASGQLSIDHL